MKLVFAALSLVVLGALPASAQVSITACGQTIPTREIGVLSADLLCDGGVGTFGVAIEHGATLDLAGHTLAGGNTGVRCQGRRCTVTSSSGIGTIRDMETAGIAVVEDSGKLSLSNVDLIDDLYAVLTNYLRGKVTGTQVTITGSGIALQGAKIQLSDFTATGNYRVSQARKMMLESSTISGSEDSAISGQSVKLTNSSVTGSGSGVDLMVDHRPRLLNSICGASAKLSNPVETWDVCTND